MKYSAIRYMKIFTIALSLISMAIMFSCSKDDNSTAPPSPVAPVLPGSWMIHYYYNVTDQTSNYTAYTFTFNANGTFTATKSGTVYNGTWKDELDSGKRKLTLDFDASVTESALLELEEDWIVESASSSLLHLKDNAVILQFMKM